MVLCRVQKPFKGTGTYTVCTCTLKPYFGVDPEKRIYSLVIGISSLIGTQKQKVLKYSTPIPRKSVYRNRFQAQVDLCSQM